MILTPKVENAKMPQLTPKRTGVVTRKDIDEKLEAAERRRKVSITSGNKKRLTYNGFS